MTKLTIHQKDRKQFEKIFIFLSKENVELCIFPEGLKWRNHQANGIIYKDAFADYSFDYRKKLGILPNNSKTLKIWFKDWKDINKFTEIPVA